MVEPNSKLEKLIGQWEKDVSSLFTTFKGKMAAIESSEVNAELRQLIKHTYDNLWMRIVTLREALPPEFVGAVDKFFEMPYEAVSRSANLLFALQNYGWRDSEKFTTALESALGVYTDPVLERVGPYAETVRRGIISRSQEIILKMDEKMLQQMEALKPQIEAQIKTVQEYYTSLEPYLDHTQELIRKGAETIHKHLLKPYIAPTLAVYEKYMEDLRGWPVLPRQP